MQKRGVLFHVVAVTCDRNPRGWPRPVLGYRVDREEPNGCLALGDTRFASHQEALDHALICAALFLTINC